MALEECRECGEQVSTEAESCPHCGAPHPTRSSSEASQRHRTQSTASPSDDSEDLDSKLEKVGKGCLFVLGGLGGLMMIGLCFSGISENGSTLDTGVGSSNAGQRSPSAEQQETASLEVVSWNWRADASFGTDGAVIYNVEVRNNSSRSINPVRIDITTYDAAGDLLASDYTYINGIPAGATRATKGHADYYGGEEKAKIQVKAGY